MEEMQAIKEIVKANATAVYADSAQPAVRVIGKSLAQCVSLFATPAGRMAEIFEKNIHRYIDKLDGIKEEDLVSPDTRILVPILEKMRFTDEEKVADYYAEILATASKKEHANKVLITFIEILNRLTADEIKILEYIISPQNLISIPAITEEESVRCGLASGTIVLNIQGALPVLEIQRTTEGHEGYRVIDKNFNNISDLLSLSAPNNIDAYIDNMISLGLIEKRAMYRFSLNKAYHSLENHPKVLLIKNQLEATEKVKMQLDQGRIDITGLGRKLLSLGMGVQ